MWPGTWCCRTAAATAIGDRSVGEIVGERLGRPVVEWLVDPLIGGIHAGGVDDLSAAATFPVLIAASHQPGKPHAPARPSPGRPGRRAVTPAPGVGPGRPLFWSLAGGVASLADRLADGADRRGVDLRTGARGRRRRTGRPDGWRTGGSGSGGPPGGPRRPTIAA